MTQNMKSISYIFFSLLVVYIVWVLFHIEELSKYNLLIASFYVETDAYREFALGLVVAFVITLFVSFFLRPYLIFWVIKIFIGLFILILREATRAFDPVNYYGNGVYNIVQYEFGTKGTHNVMHITNFFSNFTGESYYSLKVAFSFIGFLGLIFFYKAFLHIMKKSNLVNPEKFRYWIFLLPSVLLWTNNIGKDALIFVFVGLFTWGAVHLIDKFNPVYLFFIAISLFGALYIRPWYPVIMMTALGLYYVNFRSLKSIMVLILFSPVIIALFTMILGYFGVNSFEDIFLKMTDISTGFSRGGSAVEVNKITGLGSYALYFIPNSFTALFRPMLYEARNLGMLLSALENTLILYLFIKYILGNFHLILKNKYLKFLILFIFAWLLFYVIPQGNLGTTVRFKVHILPILLMIAYIGRQIREQK